MSKQKKTLTSEEKLHKKLDDILEVMQNLFILEAAKANVPVETIRAILRIDKRRIGTINKHLGSD